MQDSAKSSILLALFNKLDDHDKEIIIQLSESLVARHKIIAKNINNAENAKTVQQKNSNEV